MNKEPVVKEENDELSDKLREAGSKPKGKPKLNSKIMIFNTKEK